MDRYWCWRSITSDDFDFPMDQQSHDKISKYSGEPFESANKVLVKFHVPRGMSSRDVEQISDSKVRAAPIGKHYCLTELRFR